MTARNDKMDSTGQLVKTTLALLSAYSAHSDVTLKSKEKMKKEFEKTL